MEIFTRFVDIPWMPGVTVIHKGWTITSIEENGRKFWTTRYPGGGLNSAVRLEYSTLREACEYIDKRV